MTTPTTRRYYGLCVPVFLTCTSNDPYRLLDNARRWSSSTSITGYRYIIFFSVFKHGTWYRQPTGTPKQHYTQTQFFMILVYYQLVFFEHTGMYILVCRITTRQGYTATIPYLPPVASIYTGTYFFHDHERIGSSRGRLMTMLISSTGMKYR